MLAELLKAPAVLFFDNITSDLYPHKSLCSAITSETLTGRVLGNQELQWLELERFFLPTAANVIPVGDMTRRTIPINLDAREEFPASREFKNPDLINQLKQNRHHYVSCALTIISAWIKAGKPTTQCKTLNSFARWSELCRQPLLWLDMEDPAGNVFDNGRRPGKS